MSASHRSLRRLPPSVFRGLVLYPDRPDGLRRDDDDDDDDDDDEGGAVALRDAICEKLREAGRFAGGGGGGGGGNSNGGATRSAAAEGGGGGGSEGVTTVGQILKLSPPALLRALDPLLIHEECEELIRRILETCAPLPVTALSLLRETVDASSSSRSPRSSPPSSGVVDRRIERHVPTSLPTLDANLRGGIRIGTITELVGRAGVGKTQLALQLCVEAARRGQGSVYVDTERKLSLHRLREMATARWREESAGGGGRGDDAGGVDGTERDGEFCYDGAAVVGPGRRGGPDDSPPAATGRAEDRSGGADPTATARYRRPREVLENVTVRTPTSTEELLADVFAIEEEILSRNAEAAESESDGGGGGAVVFPVRLVILDSIARPVRHDFGGRESAPARVASLFRIAKALKRIADQLRVAVVVVNQVSVSRSDDGDGRGTSESRGRINADDDGSDFVSVEAALGTPWHHCVSTRILLEHERDPHRLGNAADAAHEGMATAADDDDDGRGRRAFGAAVDDGAVRAAWMSERGRVRTATVAKSNVAGRSTMAFEVTASGVCEM